MHHNQGSTHLSLLMDVVYQLAKGSKRFSARRLATVVSAGALALVFPTPSYAQEVIPFQSRTMTDEQFLTGELHAGNKVELTGVLTLPKGAEGSVPLVILLHGSGGPNSGHSWGWTRSLNGTGIGTFAIDSYTGRGFDEIYSDQARVGEFNNINDTFAALSILAKDPRVDADRIAVMGFSRGGIAALYSAMTRFQKTYGPPDVQLAAHIPFYPPWHSKLPPDMKLTHHN